MSTPADGSPEPAAPLAQPRRSPDERDPDDRDPDERDPNGTGHWARPALTAAAVAAGLAWTLASAWRPMPLVHAAGWLVTGLVALPLLFAGALAGVAAALSALLTLLALPHLLLRRPTGLGDALTAVWALPRGVLPGYLAALRRAQRPWLWGVCAGFVAGTAAFVAVHGFRPPAG